MNTQSSTIVQRLWNYCNFLRDKRRLSVVGEVESAVEVGLVRAGRQRLPVLRSAFEGGWYDDS
jgi:hypothetical protein